MKRFVPMLAIFLILGLPVSGEMEKAKIKEYQWQVDDLLTSDRVQEYAISPSGRWLVWSVAKWNLKEQTRFQHVFLTDLKKKKPDLQLIRGEDQINSLQWLPDEKAISFKTSRKPKEGKENNLWRLDLAGGEPYPVTDFDKGVMQAAWIDSDHLLFTARETETLLETRLKEKKDTAEVVEDEENRTMVRLFLYDMKEKKVTRLTRNLKPIMGFSLSEDKQWMIYGLSMSLLYEQDEEVRPKFFLLNLKSGEPREIFADPALKAVGRFFWSLDNRGFYAAVAYSTHPTYTMAAVEKVYWYDLRTQAAREINLDWPRYGGPLSVSKDGFIMALPDGVYYNYAGYRHQGESWQRLWLKGENLKNVSDLQVAANGNTAVYEYSTASQPSRYYLAELRVGEAEKNPRSDGYPVVPVQTAPGQNRDHQLEGSAQRAHRGHSLLSVRL